MFCRKATKIDEIFTVDLIKCQIDGEDFVKFCGLFRKHELYETDFYSKTCNVNLIKGHWKLRCLLRLFIGILLLYFLVDIWMSGLSRRIKWFRKCRVFCCFNYMNNTMGSKPLWNRVANSRYFHAPSIWRDIGEKFM